MNVEWLRKYLPRELDGFERTGLSDSARSTRIELHRRGTPSATISITLSRKVADELQADIDSGNSAGEDLIGNALAEKVRRHLRENRGASELDVDIRID